MVVFPTAKINFGLNIVSRREDGYHEIESIFYPIGISDALEINPAQEQTSISFHGRTIPGNAEDNLILKAWNILRERYSLPEISIQLVKNIPMGGGIGGGSADCGFFINLVNETFDLQLTVEEREHIAGKLGSDCPFFIRNLPSYVSGRGELLQPVTPFLSGYYLVLVYGDLHISTKEAYSGISPKRSGQYLWEIMNEAPENWKKLVKNDFEPVVFAKHPALREIKNNLYAAGAVYASLTGTGSCVYGLFKEDPGALKSLGDKVCWRGWMG
ncbi:MAG: 4-(cytidine 5'-diphospho)-2-C-methyl-D-erythritol kinase [Bacteroidota bacterium]